MNALKTEIKWAVIFVVVTLLWMTIERLVGLHDEHIAQHMIYTNLFAIPAILMYVFALREKKRKDFRGQMSFKQGFISGLIITVIVAAISPLTQWITVNVITPDYFPNVITYSVQEGIMSQAEAEASFNYGNYVVQGVIGALVMGLLTTAIVMLFLRSKKVATS